MPCTVNVSSVSSILTPIVSNPRAVVGCLILMAVGLHGQSDARAQSTIEVSDTLVTVIDRGTEQEDWLYMPRASFADLADCRQWIDEANAATDQCAFALV